MVDVVQLHATVSVKVVDLVGAGGNASLCNRVDTLRQALLCPDVFFPCPIHVVDRQNPGHTLKVGDQQYIHWLSASFHPVGFATFDTPSYIL